MEEQPSWMGSLTHRMVRTNGIDMHIVEQGAGPVVLLLHGFPEFWYSWRYQIPALAQAGFRAVAPDLRGFGQTDAPKSADDYTSMHIVGDLVGLLDELGEARVFVVGHDWGAVAAWDLCLFRPDRVAACVVLSVPYMSRNPAGSALKLMSAICGEGFYMCRFQEPGRAERDFQKVGAKASLAKLLFGGADTKLIAPEDAELMESMLMPEKQPSHITDFDYQQYIENWEKSGWTGGLNYYRSIDRSWELKAAWANAMVTSTSLFIAGKEGGVLKFPGMMESLKEQFKKDVPNLRDIVLLEGGHFVQQEQSGKVNELIISFLKGNLALASHSKKLHISLA